MADTNDLSATALGKGEFVIIRVFDAPREIVWKTWTEADRLMQWWGPKGFTMRVAKLDFSPILTLPSVAHDATDEERRTFEDGFKSMTIGFGGTFDQLADYLAKA